MLKQYIILVEILKGAKGIMDSVVYDENIFIYRR